MKRLLLAAALAVLMGTSAMADAPANYYSTCEGKTGEPLLEALFNKIKDHTVISYKKVWDLYYTSDVDENGKIIDIYSTKRWEPGSDQCTSGTGGSNMSGHVGACYTREHSFCKSWWGGSEDPMYTDGFHLYPADYYVNSHRNDNPYGECANGTSRPDYDGYSALGKLGVSTFPGYTGKVYEPIDEYKGDLARTYFYMAACYYDRIGSWTELGKTPMLGATSFPFFSDWTIELLLKWNRQDPVSPKELSRQEAVYNVQKNRNPFIDHPELIEYIWGDRVGYAWSASATPFPAINAPINGSTMDCGTVKVGVPTTLPLTLTASNLTEGVTIDISDVTFLSESEKPIPGVTSEYIFQWNEPETLNPSIDSQEVVDNTSYGVDGLTFTSGPVSITNAKGSASTAPRLYNSTGGDITLRFYGGCTTTFTTSEGEIIGIDIDTSASAMYGGINPSCGTVSDDCLYWSGRASEVVFTWAKYKTKPEATSTNNPAIHAFTVYVETAGTVSALSLTDEELANIFTIEPLYVSADDANATTQLNVTFSPVAIGYYTANVTLTSGTVSSQITLTGDAISDLTALPASDITWESFTANWVDVDAGTRTYQLYVCSDDQVIPGYPVEVASDLQHYNVADLYDATTYTYYLTRDEIVSNVITVTTAELEPEIIVTAPDNAGGMTDDTPGAIYANVCLESTIGQPSDVVTITIATANIEGNLQVSIPAPFEVSTDMNEWSHSVEIDARIDHIYLRLNGNEEGEYIHPLTVASETHTNDDILVFGRVAHSSSIAAASISSDWEAFTLNGCLTIENATESALNAVIYTLEGYEVGALTAAPGRTSVDLPTGFYLIGANGDARRVMIP